MKLDDSNRFLSVFKRYGLVVILIVLCIFFAANTDHFATIDNLFNVLRQVSMSIIISIGMAYVLITAGIDLSVGSMVGIAVNSCALMLINDVHTLAASIISILLCIGAGAINGFLVAQIKMPPLIATLGTMTAYRGLVYLVTDAVPIFGFPDSFRVLGQGYVLNIVPIPVIIAIGIVIAGWFYINKTTYGRYTYAVGGNQEVARLSGINVKKVKYITYMISGFCSGLAGVILASRLSSGQPRAGLNYEMDVITAVVLGGVSVAGGQGRIAGVIIGVLIMGVLSNGMIMMGVNEYWQMFLRGVILILAVAFDIYASQRKTKIVKTTP